MPEGKITTSQKQCWSENSCNLMKYNTYEYLIGNIWILHLKVNFDLCGKKKYPLNVAAVLFINLCIKSEID